MYQYTKISIKKYLNVKVLQIYRPRECTILQHIIDEIQHKFVVSDPHSDIYQLDERK